MKKKTILITGSTKGIGFEIARQLGDLGHRVILSGRKEEALENALSQLKTKRCDVVSLLMNVSSIESIQKAVNQLANSKIKLDVLINNAGILLREDSSLLKDSFSVLEETVQTNSFGPLLAIKSFLKLMNRPGRVINISSSGGSMTDSVGGWSPAYCVSKTMLNGITRQLAYELSNEQISVNAVCPGWVQTDMGGTQAPIKVEKGAETPVWLAVDAPQNLTGSFVKDKHIIPW
ncbi:MAG: SDR family NAD(P)-dependent oxidoreductase [Bacteroidales bacterium]|nr:SDR family NAD(P)-dependent oxidoreductase [Bacteroidales bacterium]